MDDKQHLEEARLVLKFATDTVERLEEKLAEEKVELRHGDYGYHGTFAKVAVNVDGEGLQFAGSGTLLYKGFASPITTVLGNIFDDLAALSEDVTEFDMEDITATTLIAGVDGPLMFLKMVYEDNEVEMHFRTADLSQLEGLALKLLQMKATILRNQK